MKIQFNKKSNSSGPVLSVRPKRANTPMFRWLLIVLLISMPLLYLLFQLGQTLFIYRFDGFVAYNTVVVRAPVDSYVNKLYVTLNQTVPKGATLLRLESYDTRNTLRSFYQERKILQRALDFFNRASMNALNASIQKAKQDIKQTREVYNSFYQYFKKGNIVTLQLEQARLNLSNAQHLYFGLQAQASRLTIEKQKNIADYKTAIAELDNKISIQERKLKNLTLTAPSLSEIIELNTEESEYVPEGQTLLVLSTNNNLHIIGFVDPQYAYKIEENKTVTIYFADHTKAKGTISKKAKFLKRLPPQYTNPLAERSNKILVIITPEKGIKSRNYIYGMPVKIAF